MKKKYLLIILTLMICLLPIEVHAKARLVKLKNGVTYKYDLNRDGKKEKIKVKQVAKYGVNNSFYTKKNIYINGKVKIKASSIKNINLYVFTNNKKSVIIQQSMAGDGGTGLTYYYYKSGKYKSKYLNSDFYFYEEPSVSGSLFVGKYREKGTWLTQSFSNFKVLPFKILLKYKLTAGKLKKTTTYHTVSGKTSFIALNSFTTGKTLTSIEKGDGPYVNKGDKVTLINVAQGGYRYRIKVGGKTGWFSDSSNIQFRLSN